MEEKQMKLPKIQLKSEFWEETKLIIWRDRYLKLAYAMSILAIVNIIINLRNPLVWGLNLIPILGSILAIRTNGKYETKVYKRTKHGKEEE